jgi:hypothetical protein
MSDRKVIRNLKAKPPKHERKLEVKKQVEEMHRDWQADDEELAAALDDMGILVVRM